MKKTIIAIIIILNFLFAGTDLKTFKEIEDNSLQIIYLCGVVDTMSLFKEKRTYELINQSGGYLNLIKSFQFCLLSLPNENNNENISNLIYLAFYKGK
jgi:hypothetical protein